MYPIGHLQFLLSIYIVLLHNYCSSTGICPPYNSCYNVILSDDIDVLLYVILYSIQPLAMATATDCFVLDY